MVGPEHAPRRLLPSRAVPEQPRTGALVIFASPALAALECRGAYRLAFYFSALAESLWSASISTCVTP